MSMYAILYNDGVECVYCNVPAPAVLPVAGQTLRVCTPFRTLANVQYVPGDLLQLIERTAEAPHHRRSTLGNWLVKCKHMESVWTNIEWMLAERTLVIVHNDE